MESLPFSAQATYLPASESMEYVQLSQEANYARYSSSVENVDFQLSPSAILIPYTPEDVVLGVGFARHCAWAVAPRSGGHQYAGLSNCNQALGPCLLIDMRKFQRLEIDTEAAIVTVGAGVVLGDLKEPLLTTGCSSRMVSAPV